MPRSLARLVMCRPVHYRIAYEINPWMSLRRPAHARRAQEQWARLHRLLTGTLRVAVSLLPARAAYKFAQIERFGLPILLALLFLGVLDFILRPLLGLFYLAMRAIFGF